MLGNRGGLLKHTKLISDYKLGISFFRLGTLNIFIMYHKMWYRAI